LIEEVALGMAGRELTWEMAVTKEMSRMRKRSPFEKVDL